MRIWNNSAAVLGTMLMAAALPLAHPVAAQELTERGKIVLHGQSVSYFVRRLPVSSFPALPAAVAGQLTERGCLIPQTYEAHHPENVVHASLSRPGSTDWAVLCSVKGSVSLLVFLEGSFENPAVLATAQETERLQPHDASGVLGFNWGIDGATPRQVHDAQSALPRHRPLAEHDALADSVLERRTVYHYYADGAWTLLEVPE